MLIEDIIPEYKTTCVLCETKEEVDLVDARMRQLGGRSLKPEVMSYHEEGRLPCYSLTYLPDGKNTYASLEWYEKEEYTIISAEWFLELFKEDKSS